MSPAYVILQVKKGSSNIVESYRPCFSPYFPAQKINRVGLNVNSVYLDKLNTNCLAVILSDFLLFLCVGVGAGQRHLLSPLQNF